MTRIQESGRGGSKETDAHAPASASNGGEVRGTPNELLSRISEIAGCTATTELWCSEAQKLLYDCRDEIERLTKTKPVRPYVAPLYCDEPGGSHGLDSR